MAKFKCIVGDYKKNSNGHMYTKEVWASMNNSTYLPNWCTLEDDPKPPSVDLMKVAGAVRDLQVGPDHVEVVLEILETPPLQLQLEL